MFYSKQFYFIAKIIQCLTLPITSPKRTRNKRARQNVHHGGRAPAWQRFVARRVCVLESRLPQDLAGSHKGFHRGQRGSSRKWPFHVQVKALAKWPRLLLLRLLSGKGCEGHMAHAPPPTCTLYGSPSILRSFQDEEVIFRFTDRHLWLICSGLAAASRLESGFQRPIRWDRARDNYPQRNDPTMPLPCLARLFRCPATWAFHPVHSCRWLPTYPLPIHFQFSAGNSRPQAPQQT